MMPLYENGQIVINLHLHHHFQGQLIYPISSQNAELVPLLHTKQHQAKPYDSSIICLFVETSLCYKFYHLGGQRGRLLALCINLLCYLFTGGSNVLTVYRHNIQREQMSSPQRIFKQSDIPVLLEKIFNEFDHNKDHRFTRVQFPKVVKTLINLVGGEEPSSDEIQDIFNLLDINGDETIDRKEFKSLLTTFFKVLQEKNIQVGIARETDLTDLQL